MIRWLIRLLFGSSKPKTKTKPKPKPLHNRKQETKYARSSETIDIPDQIKEDMEFWIRYYKPLVGLGNTDLDTCYRGAVTSYKREDWINADAWLGQVPNWIGQHRSTDRKRTEMKMYSHYKRHLSRFVPRQGGG